MLIVMKADATEADVEKVLSVIEALGFRGHAMPGESRTAIGVTGNRGAVDPAHFENLNGVAEAIRVTQPYKLISLDLRPEKSIVKVGTATIGGSELAMLPSDISPVPSIVSRRPERLSPFWTILSETGTDWP